VDAYWRKKKSTLITKLTQKEGSGISIFREAGRGQKKMKKCVTGKGGPKKKDGGEVWFFWNGHGGQGGLWISAEQRRTKKPRFSGLAFVSKRGGDQQTTRRKWQWGERGGREFKSQAKREGGVGVWEGETGDVGALGTCARTGASRADGLMREETRSASEK